MNEEFYEKAFEQGQAAFKAGEPKTAEPLYHAQLTVDLDEEEHAKVYGWHHGWQDAQKKTQEELT